METRKLLFGLAVAAAVFAGVMFVQAANTRPGQMGVSEMAESAARSSGLELSGPSRLDARSSRQADANRYTTIGMFAALVAVGLVVGGLVVGGKHRSSGVSATTGTSAAGASSPAGYSAGAAAAPQPRRPCPHCAEEILTAAKGAATAAATSNPTTNWTDPPS